MAKQMGDLQAFYDALRPIRCVHGGEYTPLDRYRDFRKVFGTAEGKRVLIQILDECEGLPVTLNQVSDHAGMAFRAGKREVGFRLVQWMNAVPLPDPGDDTASEDG